MLEALGIFTPIIHITSILPTLADFLGNNSTSRIIITICRCVRDHLALPILGSLGDHYCANNLSFLRWKVEDRSGAIVALTIPFLKTLQKGLGVCLLAFCSCYTASVSPITRQAFFVVFNQLTRNAWHADRGNLFNFFLPLFLYLKNYIHLTFPSLSGSLGTSLNRSNFNP